MISGRARILTTAYAVSDMALTAAALWLAHYARHLAYSFTDGTGAFGPVHPFSIYRPLLAFILPVWAAVFYVSGLYSRSRILSPRRERIRTVQAIAAGGLLLGFLLFATRLVDISRPVIVAFLAVDALFVMAGRRAMRAMVFDAAASRHILVAGPREEVARTVARLDSHRHWGVTVAGVITDGTWTGETLGGHPVFGSYPDLPGLVGRMVIDEVLFVSAPGKMGNVQQLEPLLLRLEELGIVTRLVVNFVPTSFAKVSLDQLDGMPLLTVSSAPRNDGVLFLRRIADTVLAALLLIPAIPIGLVIAAAIKLTSPGPVLFRQIRCGLNGRPFTFLKFRSMRVDAEALKPALVAFNEMDGPAFKMSEDPRVTPVGRWLRRSSLDELPQLWNILKGDMSFVGPRPAVPEEVSQYEPWQRRRLSMKPGLTCLWQIQGRNAIGFDEWMRLDLEYIDNWSPWLDLKILVKTIPAVLFGKGAR
ncbi:MAG: sugar transferase [Vicinamibacterales bacterium]